MHWHCLLLQDDGFDQDAGLAMAPLVTHVASPCVEYDKTGLRDTLGVAQI